MNESFWHQKWERGDIGFHESKANQLLIEHFDKLNLAKGSRVFLPLCGKSRDCEWLLACRAPLKIQFSSQYGVTRKN